MNFFSIFNLFIFEDNNKKAPNPIIITPPSWLKLFIKTPDEFANVLLIITPNVENTIEKPRTKNIVFSMILVLFTRIVLVSLLLFSSLRVDPEIYAKNAGINGKIHGATNEPNPAKIANARVISTMN